MADPASSDHRGRRIFRLWAWSLSGLIGLALIAALGLAALGLATMTGTRVSAPDWLRDRITQEVNARLDTAALTVGDVSILLDAPLRPRVGLRHVELRNAADETVMQIGDVQVALGVGALLRGEVQPVAAEINGVQFRLRRFDTGAVGLAVGTGGDTPQRLGEYGGMRLGFHEIMAEVDAWLTRPQLQHLTQLSLGNVTLRYEDERVGRVWTADGARLSLTRTGDDLFLRGDAALLGGGASVTTIEVNHSRRVGETGSDLGISFADMPAGDIAGQALALAWLSAVDAPISGALRAEVEEDGALGPLHATLQIGQGTLRPENGAGAIAFNGARTYFTYRPQAQEIEFSEVFVDSDWVTADASGRATLVGMETGWPRALGVEFEVSRIVANPNGLYPAPIALDRAELEMTLGLAPLVLDLEALRVFLGDEVLNIEGQARAQETGWQVSATGDLARLAPDRLLELWPDTLVPKTHAWIEANVIHADLSDIRFELEAPPGQRPSVFLGFDFADFSARFMRNVPPLVAAHGAATLRNNRFVVTAAGGHIATGQGGQIDITGTRFIIPKTNVKRTPAKVHLAAAAPITAALSFLDEGPFGYISRAGLPVDLARGRTAVTGQLDFRMMDKLSVRDVLFDLTGTLEDVLTDQLLEGRVLQAPRLDLHATHQGLKIDGPGQVGDVPFSGTYNMSFLPDRDPATAMGQVRGDIEISDRFIEEFHIVLPPGTFEGQGRAGVEIDLARDTPAALRLQTDLEGIALRIDPLNWRKPAAATGLMQVAGRLGRPPDIDRFEIEAPGLQASGTLSLRSDGALDRALFQRIEAGGWLDARVELLGRGRAVPPMVRVLGGQVDLRGARVSPTGGSGEGGPVSLQLDRLILGDTLQLTEFRAEIATGGGASGPFSGWLNGTDKITGQMVPQDGRTAFQVRSENAGAFFAALGIIRQARNGAVDLSLVPGNGPGIWEGRLAARGGMRLKDAPTMAALLNAATVVGLLEQMGGEGIHFEAVDARFQISPERLTLYSLSATGAAIGLSMDGYFYPDSKQMDLQGVISPLYLVNSVGGIISRGGEGLIGFNYTLRGPTSAPRVSVNPLSALTPGMFRDLFRRAPPQRDVSTKDVLDLDTTEEAPDPPVGFSREAGGR